MQSLHIRLLLVSFLFANISMGQQTKTFSYIKYSENKNIPGPTIYGINQDKNGYIWFGSNRGISKFDGTAFNNNILEGKDIPVSVDRIFKWENNQLLLIENYSNKVFFIKKNKCNTSPINIKNLQGVNMSQSSIDNSITIHSNASLFYFQEDKCKLAYTLNKFPKERYSYIKNFKEDSLFISTNRRAFIISKDTIFYPKLRGASNLLTLDDSSLIFVQNKIYSLKKGKCTYLYSIKDTNIKVQHSICDSYGNIWLAGKNNGLYLLQNRNISNISSSLGVKGVQITYLFLDKLKNVWISTISKGVICILKSNFINYSTHDGLCSNNITCINEWDNSILLGTNAGLNIIRNKNVVNKDSTSYKLDICDSYKVVTQGYIHQLVNAKDNLLISSDKNYKKRVNCSGASVYSKNFKTSYVMGDTIYLGGWNSIRCLIIKDKFKRSHHINTQKERLNKKYFIYKSHNKNNIYIGTSIGLFETDKNLSICKQVHVPGISDDKMAFHGIKEDINNNLWFATSKGLLKLDSNGEKWELFNHNSGLNSSYITSIEIDKTGAIWLGTDNGLTKYQNKEFISYTKGSGLISNVITTMHYSRKKNTLWLGTDQGVSSINLSLINNHSACSFPLTISKIEVVGDTSLQVNKKIDLSHNQNSIKIRYSSTDYVSPSDISYQYRLLPTDSSWKKTYSNTVEFIGLTSNSYEFQVRSKTSGSTWGRSAKLAFIIRPPFWKTITFFSLFLILTIFFISVGFRRHLIKLKKERAVLLRENYLEQQALSMSMNPHFIFNSLNSIQSYVSHLKNNETSEYIASFSKLIRLNMDSSRKKSIPINDEIKRLNLYLALEKKRMDKPLKFNIQISEQTQLKNPMIPSMVVQPFIENSIWHGILPSENPGNILIHIEGVHPIHITIIDNGIGLRKSSILRKHIHKPLGISIIKERLSLLSKKNQVQLNEIHNEKGEVCGTKVFLTIYT